jgi:hypothetical protein
LNPGKRHGPSSCRGVTSFEYAILTSLVMAAVLAAFVQLELHIPRLFQNATVSLQHARADLSQGHGDGAGGSQGTIENGAPAVPGKAAARVAP